MKSLPRAQRIALLDEIDDDDCLTAEPYEYGIKALERCVSVSKYSAHRISGRLNRVRTKGCLDGGSCVNTISEEFAKSAGITIHTKKIKMGFRQIDGTLAKIVGEAYDVPFEMDDLIVPITAVVISLMDGSLLLGRPFLEQTNAVADYSLGTFALQYNGWTAILPPAQSVPKVIRYDGDHRDVFRSYTDALKDNGEIQFKNLEECFRGTVDSNKAKGKGKAVGAQRKPRTRADARNDNLDRNDGSGSEEDLGDDDISDEENLRGIRFFGGVPTCTREEVQEWSRRGEISDVRLLSNADRVDDLKGELWQMMDAALGERESKDDEDPVEDLWIDREGFGVLLKCESKLPSVTPLRSLENEPGLEGYKISIGDLPENQPYQSELVSLLIKYKDRFLRDGDLLHPFTNIEPAKYELKPGVPMPRPPKPRKYSEKEAASILAYKEKNQHYMEPTTSRVACLPLVVKKKDGGDRICVNYIPVNRVIAPLVWPMKRMEYVTREASRYDWHSFWDFYQGYYAVPIDPDYRYLTAVLWPDGTVTQMKVAVQGFKDSGQWFTRAVSEITNDPVLKKHIGHYVDDGHLSTDTQAEHLQLLEKWFQRLRYYNGSLAAKKCGFLVRTFTMLGIIVTKDKIYPDPSFMKKCKGYQIPRNTRELKGFIQFAAFYQQRIPKFAELSYPLRELCRKNKNESTGFVELFDQPYYREAYDALKSAFLKSVVSRRFSQSSPVILATDASDVAVGYVLAQPEDPTTSVDVDVVYEPVTFGGRILTGAELRYTTPEKEVLAVVEAFRKLRHYLLDCKTHLFTDHSAMLNYMTNGSVSSRITKWLSLLSEFDYEVHHRPRRNGKDADALTRMNWPPAPWDKEFNEVVDDTLPQIICEKVNDDYRISVLEADDVFYSFLRRMLTGDELVEEEENVRRRIRRASRKFEILDGDLYRRAFDRPRLYVPPADRFRLLKSHHGSKDVVHLGVIATFNKLRLRYYWPNMWNDIKNIIASCMTCAAYQQKAKTRRSLYRIPPPARFSTVVGMDAVGPLPGPKKFAISVICYLTSYAMTVPVPKLTAKWAKYVLRIWCYRYGFPNTIVTDNGSSFAGEFKAYCYKHNIDIAYASVHYPETNGKIERYQGVVFTWIAKELYADRVSADRWVDCLEKAVWSWNTQEKEGLFGASPYRMVFGQDPRSDLSETRMREEVPLTLDEMDELMEFEGNAFVQGLREYVRERIRKEQESLVERGNVLDRVPRSYQIGDKVWVWDRPLENQHGRKMDPPWTGPYVIRSVVGMGAYVLEDEDGNVISKGKTYNRDHLKPWRDIGDNHTLMNRFNVEVATPFA